MTHPGVYLLSVGLALGVAVIAYLVNRPEQHSYKSNPSSRKEFVSESTANCTICLSPITNEISKKYLNCGHCFHNGCIGKWLTVKKTCPNCNRPV